MCIAHVLFDILDVVVLASFVLAAVRLLYNSVNPPPILLRSLDKNVLTFEGTICHVGAAETKLITTRRNTLDGLLSKTIVIQLTLSASPFPRNLYKITIDV